LLVDIEAGIHKDAYILNKHAFFEERSKNISYRYRWALPYHHALVAVHSDIPESRKRRIRVAKEGPRSPGRALLMGAG